MGNEIDVTASGAINSSSTRSGPATRALGRPESGVFAKETGADVEALEALENAPTMPVPASEESRLGADLPRSTPLPADFLGACPRDEDIRRLCPRRPVGAGVELLALADDSKVA
ncbi:MAG: hypothetical protein U0414_40100 [Polyangiaceae bacterium]